MENQITQKIECIILIKAAQKTRKICNVQKLYIPHLPIYLDRVCKVLVTVRRDGVSPSEQNLYADEDTSSLQFPQFPSVKQTLKDTLRTSFNLRVSTKTLHTHLDT